MRFVYAPWRLPYVQSQKTREGCVFCRAFSDEPSVENLVLYRDGQIAVMLNRYPYTNGHMLVIPRAHADTLTALDAGTRAACAEALAFCETLLRRVYRAQGVNLGMNLGEAGGAGITDHLHWHALPRWSGDTNFIATIGGTRVLPEDLASAFEKLRGEFPERIG